MPALHHDEPAGVVREPGGFVERRAGRQRQAEGRDDRVAGAGHVRDLVGSEDRNVNVGLPRLEERHAAAAARDEQRLHAGAAAAACGRPARARSTSSSIRMPSDLLDLRLVRRARRQAAVVEQPVAAVDQHRDGPPPRPLRQRPRGSTRRAPASRGRIRSRTGARRRSRPAPGQLRGERAARRPRASGQPVSRSMRTTCCFAEWTPPARMRVLTGVRYCFARTTSGRSTPRAKLASSRRPSRIGADHARERGAPAERRDVVGGVAGAAGDDLRRVVLEDEDRRLARHAGHLAVDELVGDQIADDEHAAAREAVDEAQQPLPALGLAGQRVNRARDQHSRHVEMTISDCRFQSRLPIESIQLPPRPRLLTTASAVSPRCGCSSSVSAVAGSHQHARARRRLRASATSSQRSPTVNERARIDAELAHGAVDQAAPGLAAVAGARVLGHLAVGMVRTIVIRVDDARPPAASSRAMCAMHRVARPPR